MVISCQSTCKLPSFYISGFLFHNRKEAGVWLSASVLASWNFLNLFLRLHCTNLYTNFTPSILFLFSLFFYSHPPIPNNIPQQEKFIIMVFCNGKISCLLKRWQINLNILVFPLRGPYVGEWLLYGLCRDSVMCMWSLLSFHP